jgi:hypothetical protein
MTIPLDTPPGTEVICVDANPRDTTIEMPLVEGRLYTVRGWTDCYIPHEPSVLLEEVCVRVPAEYCLRGVVDMGFYRDRFRLVDRLVLSLERSAVRELEDA